LDLEFGTFILLLFALVLFWLAGRLRRASGLPAGEVVYADTGAWGRVEKPLFAAGLQLSGKPDYLVRDGSAYIPVEVKSGRAPAEGAYAAHIFQLAAYCALVAEAYRQRPRYGLIKYADKVLKVEYTGQLEAELLRLLDEIRGDAEAGNVARSHDSLARCRACGFNSVCSERLTG
jgi:CRISPR-associated exonuclease Cas4